MTNSKHTRVEMVVQKENENSICHKTTNTESQCLRPSRSPTESPHSKHSQSSRSSPVKIINPKNHKSRESHSLSPSPTNGFFYAGAKFSEPPAPRFLPKPPTAWTYTSECKPLLETHTLRMLLKVEA